MRNSTWIPIMLAFSAATICFASAASAEIINVGSGQILFYDGFETQPANKVSHKLYPDAMDAAPTGDGGAGGSYFIAQGAALLNAQVTDHVGTPDPGAYTGNNYLRCSRYDGSSCNVYQALAENQAVGTHLRLTEMVYVTNNSNYTAGIHLWSQDHNSRVLTVATYGSSSVQYYGSNNAFSTIAGISFAQNKWQKWEVDYVVGANTCSLSIDGTTVSNIPVYSKTTLVGSVMLSGGSANKTPVYFDEARLIPEPSMMALLAGGLVGLLAYAWRKRK